MLQTWLKNQQIEHKKLRFSALRILISLSLSIYEQKCPYQNTKATLFRWSIGWTHSLPSWVIKFESRLCQFYFIFQTFFTANLYSEHLSTCFWTVQIVLCDQSWSLDKQYRSVRRCYNTWHVIQQCVYYSTQYIRLE